MPRSPKSLIASDGYEYKDLTQRLLGNPLKEGRNPTFASIRRNYPRNEADAFVRAYDKRRGGHPDKYYAGRRAIGTERKRTNDAGS